MVHLYLATIFTKIEQLHQDKLMINWQLWILKIDY